MKFTLASVALAASGTFAAPTRTVEKRDTSISCGAFGSLQTGGYTIYHNNWGAGQATSGSQCTSFKALSGSSVSWSTSWSWAGAPIQVKSYSNVALENVGKQLSAVSSIPSTWKWSQTSSGTPIADVAYDLWLAPSKGGSNAYEIMIWLGSFGGAGPISETGDTPLATVSIGGTSYKLYTGMNGDVRVYSFVAAKNNQNFSGDLNLFFKYLTSSQGVPKSYWITSLQAGTEPFTGSNVVLTTSAYTISVK